MPAPAVPWATSTPGGEQISVTYDLRGEVAVVTLDRPAVFNSIDQSITDGMTGALARAASEARAAVITGAGKAFCAGADLADLLGEYERGGPALEGIIERRFNPIIAAVLDAEVPVVAAVNGAAAGAGMGLALACDLRVLADGAFFMSAFVNVGLIPDSGSAWFLPQMVGVSRAMEIAMSGRRVPAAEALELGLAHRVVAADSVVDEAMTWAEQLADGPTIAYPETRRMIHMGGAATLSETLAEEAETQGRLGALPTHMEGMTAFVEKRRPDFRSAGS